MNNKKFALKYFGVLLFSFTILVILPVVFCIYMAIKLNIFMVSGLVLLSIILADFLKKKWLHDL